MSILSKATTFHTNAIREGMNIVRRVLQTHDISKGVTTQELYELALREPSPPSFKGDPRLDPRPPKVKYISVPPQNDHPIRSKSFLKRAILPALEGSKEIIKVPVMRETTQPITVRKKGKATLRNMPGTQNASDANPVPVTVFVWKKFDLSLTKAARKKGASGEEEQRVAGTGVKVSEDWSHLNRRRAAAREEKIERDLATMKRLQARESQAATTS